MVGPKERVMTHVVTTFLKHRGAVLLTQRAADAEADPGRWDGLSAPHYPFCFETPSRELATLPNVADTEWMTPTAIVDRDTVPGLWEAYQQVAPSPATIADDTAHGAAALSIRALEVLRDRAAVVDDWAALVEVAEALEDAQPSMAVLANRVNRVMSGAAASPTAVHDRAIEEIDAALDADAAAAATAADRLTGPIATLSWSGTVKDALLELDTAVTVGEGRPNREGVDLAEALADAGRSVTVTTDGALPAVIAREEFGAVLVGADTILPTGDVVNKAGTRGLALAADAADVPVLTNAGSNSSPPNTAQTPSGIRRRRRRAHNG